MELAIIAERDERFEQSDGFKVVGDGAEIEASLAQANDPLKMSPDPVTTDVAAPRERPQWHSVAIPTEHGGWGLTLEPAVLGLVVRPTVAGLALGIAAIVAFVARTPIKLALVDISRGRRYDRTRLAIWIGLAEMVLLGILLLVAIATARAPFWWPLAVSAPLLALELWYGMRSRSRRLLPEMAGTIGIGSVAAAIILAGDGPTAAALGAWLVVIARASASVPFSRLQIRRLKGKDDDPLRTDSVQFMALAAVLVGWQIGWLPVAAPVAVAALALIQLVMSRRRPPKASILGVQQMVVGLAVVIATAIGINQSV